MLGAIIGDMAGSEFEFHPWRGDWRDIPLITPHSEFTDDTVMTLAIADALMSSGLDADAFGEAVIDNFHKYGQEYPGAGYGGHFAGWLRRRERMPYNSCGNGSSMRVSPVGWAFDNLPDTERFAAISAAVTHNHPEGVKGAQAVAGSIFLARAGSSKDDIKKYVTQKYGYDLNRPLAEIQAGYRFEVTCQKSVPEAIIAFLESETFEEAIQKAIWLGGDADTQGAIAGSIAEAFYGSIPTDLKQRAMDTLDAQLREKVSQWRDWLNARK